jgi:hypothetical protein
MKRNCLIKERNTVSGLKETFFHGNLKHTAYVLKAVNFLPRKSFQELNPCLFHYLLYIFFLENKKVQVQKLHSLTKEHKAHKAT